MDNSPLIVQLSACYPPKIGGMERVVKTTAEILAERGHRVLVITFKDDHAAPRTETKGSLTVKRLGGFELARIPFAPALAWNIFSLDRNSIIHLHLSQAYWPDMMFMAAKIKRIPYIVHFHLDVGPSSWLGPIFLLYKKIMWGPLLRGAKKVIVFSETQRSLVEEKYGVKNENVRIIPNGVGKEFFVAEPKKAPHVPLRILSVSRLSTQKRIDRMIRAMSTLTIPAHLTIAGDGDLEDELKKLVADLKLTNISFVGSKTSEELHAYHRDADVFAITSDREGMPLAVLEAMAGAMPIFGSNVIGTRELLKGVGVLVDEPYPEEFAKALQEVAKDASKFRTLSEQSLAAAHKYSWDALIDRLENVYKEINQ